MSENPELPEPLEPKKGSLLRSSLAMASGTLVSRILGFVRSALLVAAIGVTAGTAAAFNLANTLPNMVYNLLAAGIVNAILIPQIVRALKSRSGSEYVSKLLTAAGTILFGVTIAAMAATPLLITILAPTLPGPVRSLTISFAIICVPQIFFYGVYNLLGELLNARGIFGPYMWAPVANNLIGIASLIAFLKLWGRAGEVLPAETFTNQQIMLLAGASTFGVIIQAAVLFIPLRKAGVPLRLDFRFRGTDFGSAGKVASWTFATLLVSQIGVISTTNLASRGDTFTELTGEVVAGLQAYQYAFMLFMVPQSLIAVTIATAMFTRMADDASDRNMAAVAANYHRGVQLILLFSFAATAVLMVAANPLMAMIMPGFGNQASSQYGMILVALMLGLPSIGLVLMSQRMFFALENAKPVFLMGIVPTALQLIVGWGIYFLTDAQWWTAGAATAETVTRVVQGFIAVFWVSIVIREVNAGRVVAIYLKYLLAFAGAAGVGWTVNHFILHSPTTSSTGARFVDATFQSIVLGLVVGFTYFALLRVIDPDGFTASVGMVTARLGLKKGATKRGSETAGATASDTSQENIASEAAKAELDQPLFPSGEPGSFADLEMDLLAEGGAFDEHEDDSALNTSATPPPLSFDAPEPSAEHPAHSRHNKHARPVPDITHGFGPEADSASAGEDEEWTNVGSGEGASWALSRNLSGAEVASTGAIPVITGGTSILDQWVSTQTPTDGQKNIKSRSRRPLGAGSQAPPSSTVLPASTAVAPRATTVGAAIRKVKPMSPGRNAKPGGSRGPAPKRGLLTRFNPTVPALVLGVILLIGGALWAGKTAMQGSREDWFAELQGAGPAAQQSAQSEEDVSADGTDAPAETATPVIAGVRVFSWSDDDGDHPELVAALTDGDPSSVWRSRYFRNNQFAEGTEIALLVNLEQPAVVSEVDMTVLGSGGEVVIRNVTDDNPRDGEILATASLSPDTVIKLAQPTEVAALGIQFLSLPTDDEGMFRAKLTSLTVK